MIIDTMPLSDTAIDIDVLDHGTARRGRSAVKCSAGWCGRWRSLVTPRMKFFKETRRHPNGIAGKYAKRLDREVERCFRKWQLRNPKPATSDGAPEWPDLTEEGEPKRTYRNARAAIIALGIICSYDEFHDRMLVAGHEINQWAGELSMLLT